ncbi:CRP-like cAMP-binding protein [Parabacteroides sp. PF5-9]|nr:CRP-like cAMP-binding protein [Parabacteroides sp. PF5-9]
MSRKKESPAGQQGQEDHHKDKRIRLQKQALFAFFLDHHSTTYHAAEATGITRPNCTRLIRQLEDDGLIERTHQGICPISKESKVWYFKVKGGR